MSIENTYFSFNLTHTYFEVARATVGPLQFHQIHGGSDNARANTVLGFVSISVIYSYLAIEAFINYRLYRLWEQRHDGSEESKRFISKLGDQVEFKSYFGQDPVRELKSRIRTLCSLLDCRDPHEVIPDVWQDFTGLVKTARHFLVHPYPDNRQFQSEMERILNDNPANKYFSVAIQLLSFLHNEFGIPVPTWMNNAELFRIKVVEILA